jgi:hypothetical protein
MEVQRNIEARSCNHCRSGEAMNITRFECIPVPLGIQNALRKRRDILSVVCSVLQSFSTLSHKREDFRKKNIEFKMGVLKFSSTFLGKHFSFYEKLSRISLKT